MEELFEHYNLMVDPQQVLRRLDHFLLDRLPNTTRNKLKTAIKAGFVQVNGTPKKASYKVRPHDNIRVVLPKPPRDTEVVPENIPLDIIYEDEALLVVNKPAEMVVHPAYNHWEGTLVNALAYHFEQLPTLPNNIGRPGLVHRIDKGTSGLLVVAKTEEAMTFLAKQFYDHSITRRYVALVWGWVNEAQGTVDAPLGRHPKDRREVIVTTNELGKRAVTHYEVLERLLYVTLVACRLETGRTHQIRAHMRYLGYALFGDERYGGLQIRQGPAFSKYKAFVQNCFKLMPRQALHAQSLGFIHPFTHKKLYFEAPLPEDFMQVLTKWRTYSRQALSE